MKYLSSKYLILFESKALTYITKRGKKTLKYKRAYMLYFLSLKLKFNLSSLKEHTFFESKAF